MAATRNLFLALSFAALVSLWGSMYFNGTIDVIEEAKAKQNLPSGRGLLVKFTGLSTVDGILATLVGFFDGITSGEVLASHLLLWDLCCVIQCVTIWVMVDGFNLREQDALVRSPAIWGLLWNNIGLAVILPIYCVVRLGVPRPKGSGLSIGDGYALIFSAAISFLPAVLMNLPPLVSRTGERQQAMILLYALTPVIFSLAQSGGGAFINQFQYQRETNADARQRTIFVYLVAAAVATAGHFYVFLRAFLSGSPAATLADVFIPRPSKLDGFPGDRLTAGAHLFSQYDYLIVAITCFVYIYGRLQRQLDSDTALSQLYAKSTLMIALALSVVLLGPGATLMLSLWAQERFASTDHGAFGRVSDPK